MGHRGTLRDVVWLDICFDQQCSWHEQRSWSMTAYWGHSWAFFPNDATWLLTIKTIGPYATDSAFGLFVQLMIFSGVQGIITLGMHVAEIIINLSRDEDNWRLYTTMSGYNPNCTLHCRCGKIIQGNGSFHSYANSSLALWLSATIL